MIGLEPTFDEHLDNLVAVFREVRRVLRSDGTCWLNYGSCYASGSGKMGWSAAAGAIRGIERRDAAPSQPHQHRNAPSCGNGGKGLLNCLEPDCVCSGLCGECQALIRSHHDRNDCTSLYSEQSLPLGEMKGHDNEQKDCSRTLPSPPELQESSKPQSSPPLQGACSQEHTRQASELPSVQGSWPLGAQESACRGCGQSIDGIASQDETSSRHTSSKELSCKAYSNYSIANHKPKDLINMPAFVAEALRADGWWLRSEIIWHKPNPMPESVTDRPTSAHEKIFLLSKSARYFYDSEAVSLSRDGQGQSEVRASRSQAPHADGRINTNGGRMEGDSGQPRKQMPLLWGDGEVDDGPCDSSQQGRGARQGKHRSGMQELQRQEGQQTSGPNLRNVWKISTHSFSEAHFATFPPALVEPCIKAGTSERGVCAECGAPWEAGR